MSHPTSNNDLGDPTPSSSSSSVDNLADDELADVDPTPIDHPVDDEAIASAVNAAAAEVADAVIHEDLEANVQQPSHDDVPQQQRQEQPSSEPEPLTHQQQPQDEHVQSNNEPKEQQEDLPAEQLQQPMDSSDSVPTDRADGGAVSTKASDEPAMQVELPTDGSHQVDPSSNDHGGSSLEGSTSERDPPPSEQQPIRKAKKRVRRVGKVIPRKVPKLEMETVATNPTVPDSTTAMEGTMTGSVASDTPMTGMVENSPNSPMLTNMSAPTISPTAGVLVQPPPTMADGIPRVLSKHDEKWNAMLEKLIAFKNQHNTTLVPQCYDQDSRLGRWVHYQRVEYWIYQQSGTGKITPERIARLDAIGFEWDPQRSQWNHMFEKLSRFKQETGHCKVPKGYIKDPELANWVRNQRLEHANMKKGKKSRMTPDRFQQLDALGFRWSLSMPGKSKTKNNATAVPTEESTNADTGKEEESKPVVPEDTANSGAPPENDANREVASTEISPPESNVQPEASDTVAENAIQENLKEETAATTLTEPPEATDASDKEVVVKEQEQEVSPKQGEVQDEQVPKGASEVVLL